MIIKHRLGFTIDEAKRCLIENLKGKSSVVDANIMFIFDFAEKDSDEQREYIELKEAMISSLHENDASKPFGFDYKPKHIGDLESKIIHRDTRGDFISKFDIERLKTMIAMSDANELNDFRSLLFAAYRRDIHEDRNIYYSISEKDKTLMLGLVQYFSNNKFDDFDKVKLLQLEMLKEELTEMINA